MSSSIFYPPSSPPFHPSLPHLLCLLSSLRLHRPPVMPQCQQSERRESIFPLLLPRKCRESICESPSSARSSRREEDTLRPSFPHLCILRYSQYSPRRRAYIGTASFVRRLSEDTFHRPSSFSPHLFLLFRCRLSTLDCQFHLLCCIFHPLPLPLSSSLNILLPMMSLSTLLLWVREAEGFSLGYFALIAVDILRAASEM